MNARAASDGQRRSSIRCPFLLTKNPGEWRSSPGWQPPCTWATASGSAGVRRAISHVASFPPFLHVVVERAHVSSLRLSRRNAVPARCLEMPLFRCRAVFMLRPFLSAAHTLHRLLGRAKSNETGYADRAGSLARNVVSARQFDHKCPRFSKKSSLLSPAEILL